jgi:hypothetical protein
MHVPHVSSDAHRQTRETIKINYRVVYMGIYIRCYIFFFYDREYHIFFSLMILDPIKSDSTLILNLIRSNTMICYCYSHFMTADMNLYTWK